MSNLNNKMLFLGGQESTIFSQLEIHVYHIPYISAILEHTQKSNSKTLRHRLVNSILIYN